MDHDNQLPLINAGINVGDVSLSVDACSASAAEKVRALRQACQLNCMNFQEEACWPLLTDSGGPCSSRSTTPPAIELRAGRHVLSQHLHEAFFAQRETIPQQMLDARPPRDRNSSLQSQKQTLAVIPDI